MSGWLLAQLPRVMKDDRVIEAFVGGAEEIADSIRVGLDAVEHQLDPDLASEEMLTFLATWLGFPLDRLDDTSLQRPLVRELGHGLPTRGTRAGLQGLLSTLTGGPVTVSDGGGVFGPGEQVPPENPRIFVQLSQMGPVHPDRLKAIAMREVPIGVQVDIGPPPGWARPPEDRS